MEDILSVNYIINKIPLNKLDKMVPPPKNSKYRLYYIIYPSILERYNNAKWIFNNKDSKFINEFLLTIKEAISSWKSFK
jgi:hypothetical protein